MKSFFILLFFVIFWINGSCQQKGLFAGYFINNYYDLASEDPHFKSSYKPGNGATVGIRFDRLKIIDKLRSDTFLLGLSFKFTYYSGDINISDGGLGSGRTINLHSEKYIVGLDIKPLNIRIYKELRFSVGGEISYLIAHKDEGFQSGWDRNSGTTYVELEDTTIQFNHPLNFGINLNLEYNCHLGNQTYLIPGYNFYYGITNEFNNLGTTIRSYRHCFNLGIAKRY